MDRAEKWGRSPTGRRKPEARSQKPEAATATRTRRNICRPEFWLLASGFRLPSPRRATTPFFLLCLALALTAIPAQAQGQRGSQTAKAIAPIDLTGYWVSVVSE